MSEFNGLSNSQSRIATRLGAVLFLLWGILHVWVAFAGIDAYLHEGLIGQWSLLIGGVNVPREAFVHPTDPATALAQSQLIINFCLDVGGYGVLALFVAWGLWVKPGWVAYAVGTLVIGIGDLAFSFMLVEPGVIERTFPVLAGPILWVLAVVITPWGLVEASPRSSL